MKSILIALVLLLSMNVSRQAQAAGAAADSVHGLWTGRLAVQGTSLRIVFNIATDDQGRPFATLDSPDQGASGIPVTSVRAAGDSLHIIVSQIGGAFHGRFVSADSVDGVWMQSGQSFDLNLSRSRTNTSANVLSRPQVPKPPYPYATEEVVFEGGGVQLAGTLTLPDSNEPAPAAVLISGSGAQDRDESLAGHRPFLILADHLTRNGIAVLRFDDRGVGGSKGSYQESRAEDNVRDVIGAIEYLRSRKEIDDQQIGLIGHSEGGLMAIRTGASRDDIAFAVLMAAPGIPGDELLRDQARAIGTASGLNAQMFDLQMNLQDRLLKMVLTEDDESKLEQALLAVFSEIGVPKEAAAEQITMLKSRRFRELLEYDPSADVRRISAPVLILAGGKDLQVPADKNVAALRKALESSGESRFNVLVFPDLNHLFQTSTTGLPNEYAQISETMAVPVLDTISGWIEKQVR